MDIHEQINIHALIFIYIKSYINSWIFIIFECIYNIYEYNNNTDMNMLLEGINFMDIYKQINIHKYSWILMKYIYNIYEYINTDMNMPLVHLVLRG